MEDQIQFESVLDKQLVEEFGDAHGFMGTEKLLLLLEEVAGSGTFVVERAEDQEAFVSLLVRKVGEWDSAREFALLSTGSLMR